MRGTQVAATGIIALTLVGVGLLMFWSGELQGRANQIGEILPQLQDLEDVGELPLGMINVDQLEAYMQQTLSDSELWLYLALAIGVVGTITAVALYSHGPKKKDEYDGWVGAPPAPQQPTI